MLRPFAARAAFFLSVLVVAGVAYAEVGGGHGAAAGHGAAGQHAAAHVDWKTLGWHAANLAVFLAGLVYFLRKPIMEFLAQRRAVIAEGLEEAGRLRSEAATKLQELEGKLGNLAGERDKLLAVYREEGERERSRLGEAAQKAAEALRREVQFMLEQETRALQRQIRSRAAEAAVALAEDAIRREITAQDRVRLADEYIEKLKLAASPR